MKLVIFFVILISLTIVNAEETGDEPLPKNCEQLFKVSKCSDCQQEIWDAGSSKSTCGFFINLIVKIVKNYIKASEQGTIKPYEMGPYNDAVKEICHEKFTCKYEEAESIWRRVEKKCSNELHTRIDLSANPLTLDKTVLSAYGTVLVFYLGIPDHDAMCVKSSSGEFCGIESAKPVVDWLKEKIPDGKFVFSPDQKFVYKLDGTRFEVPRELYTCGECPKKMIKFYKKWPHHHPLPDYLVKNFFGSWKELADYYTCPNDNYKMKLRRSLGRRITEIDGFAHFMAPLGFTF